MIHEEPFSIAITPEKTGQRWNPKGASAQAIARKGGGCAVQVSNGVSYMGYVLTRAEARAFAAFLLRIADEPEATR